jgi:hypothetical protein
VICRGSIAIAETTNGVIAEAITPSCLAEARGPRAEA